MVLLALRWEGVLTPMLQRDDVRQTFGPSPAILAGVAPYRAGRIGRATEPRLAGSRGLGPFGLRSLGRRGRPPERSQGKVGGPININPGVCLLATIPS